MIIKKCPICKIEFKGNKRKVYCSKKCYKQHKSDWAKSHRQYYNNAVKKWRKQNHKKELMRIRLREKNIKIKVMTHYSNGQPICACCGESLLGFLTIDHINGCGSKHRKELGGNGTKLYRWLIRNNYPKGYQVLCYNCNCGRDKNGGICPHKSMNNLPQDLNSSQTINN